MNVTVFKDLFKSTDVPYILSIGKVLTRIQNGTSKEIIDKIRDQPDKEKRDLLKKKLPAILFAGEFSARNKDGLKQHSGFMITDFDNFPDEETYAKVYDDVSNNQHVAAIFRSPSGKGFKPIVRIPPCDKKDHERYFKAFNREFQYPYWDESNCDVSRVCYESYDPDMYINKDAEVYSPELIDDGYEVKEYVSYTPLVDEDKIIEKIMQWNWNKDFVEGERNNFIFDIAGVFCEFGVSQETAIGYILNNVVRGDFSTREAETTIKNVYRKRNFGSRFFEDYDKKNRLTNEIKIKKKEYILEKYDLDETQYEEVKEEVEDGIFWYFEENKKGEIKTKIDPLKYKFFLERNGFKKIFHDDGLKPIWVKIESNKVEETSPEKIKDFVLTYLLEAKEHRIWSYCANYQTLFSDKFLLMLETIDLLMLKDSKYKSYIAFNNGILEITKDNIKLIDYIDVDGYIWKSQIINRDFTSTQKMDNEYKVFINNISDSKPLAIECVIGYLLSTYKNKMNNKAIILNDEVISENPEGGTGKGLFIQGIRQIRKVSILDGKTFDDKKSFPYQTVSKETQVLVFDDVKKNWDFESKFSLVTEGMTLERKNKDAIKLSVEESPKMVVSTNYAIKGEGNSHDRRRHEIEIAQYYGKNLSPFDEFERQLFDDWNADEFNAFDNYMIYCLQMYLQNGLVTQEAKNIAMRKFIAETSMEFKEWVFEADNFPLNTRNNKSDMFIAFTNEYRDFTKWLTRKRFQIWVQKYASFIDCKFEQGNSNGNRWFSVIETGKELDSSKPKVTPEHEPEEDDGLPF